MYINKIMKKLISVAMVLMLVMTPIVVDASSASELKDKLNETKDQLDDAHKNTTDAKNEVNNAQSSVNKINGEKDKIQATYNNYNSQLNTITANMNATQAKIDDKQAEINKTQAELDEATRIAEEQYASMKRRIQYMYETSSYSTNLLITLISSGSVGEFLNRADNIESLSTYDRHMLDDYIETQEQIQAVKDELLGQKAELDEQKAELDNQHTQMNSLLQSTAVSLDKKKQELNGANATLKSAKEKLAEMEAVESQIQELYEQAQLALAKQIAAEGGAYSNSEGKVYNASDSERDLLAGIIYAEAGNQGLVGQVYVGSVVMNRVFSDRFPGDISSVVYQNGQFTPAGSGRLEYYMSNGLVSKSCYDAADMVLAGTRYTHEYFFCTRASAIRQGYLNEDLTPNGRTSGIIYLAHYFWHYGSGEVLIL